MANGFDIQIDPTDIDVDLYDVPVLVNLSSSSGKGSFDSTGIFTEITDPTKIKPVFRPVEQQITHEEAMLSLEPESYWRLHDVTANGTAVDEMSNQNGTYVSATDYATGLLVNDTTDSGVYFTDDTYHFDTNTIIPASNQQSVSFLFRLEGSSIGFNYTVVGMSAGDGATTRRMYLHFSPQNDVITMGLGDGTSVEYDTTAFTQSVGNVTYHIVMVYDGTNIKLYIDNSLVIDTDLTISFGGGSAGSDLVFGKYGNTLSSPRLVYQEIGYFQKALTATDVNLLYQTYKDTYYPVDDTYTVQYLKTEIERWDQSGTEAELRIKVPYVSKDVRTLIHLNYDSGNSASTSDIDYVGGAAAQAVWSEYDFVYHLSTDGSESSVNGADATLNGIDGTNITDFGIGKGMLLDGTSEYLSITAENLIRNYTISMEIELDNVTGTKALLEGSNDGWYINGNVVSYNNTSDDSTTLSATTKYHISFQDDESSGLVYIDGVLSGSVSPAVSNMIISTIAADTTPGNYFKGKIKELRISKDNKTADWIALEALDSTDDLVTFSQSALLTDITEVVIPKTDITVTSTALDILHETADIWDIGSATIGVTSNALDIFKGKSTTIGSASILVSGNSPLVPLHIYMALTDGFSVSSSASTERFQIFKVIERIVQNQSYILQHTGNYSVTESFNVRSLTELYISLIVAESFRALSYSAPSLVVDKLVQEIISSSDIASVQTTSIEHIVEAVNIIDEIFPITAFILTEGISVVDNISIIIKNIFEIVEAIEIADSLSGVFTAVFYCTDGCSINDEVSNQAVFSNLISEKISTFGTIVIDDENYTFVINSKTKGISEYTNYNFNSMSDSLGATSTGIYSLTGNDDTGTNIDAYIKTGLIDFGTSLEKQVPYAYIGLNKSGRLMLKTDVTYRGQRKERWYEITPRTVNAPDNVRIKTGRGVKARYWQFELVNIDGSDFEIDSLEMLPLILKRRI